jgi:Protein of unknown function (DUF1616)
MTARDRALRAGAPLLGVALLAELTGFPTNLVIGLVSVTLALLLPGYALTRALPGLGADRDPVSLVGLSFVLSLASYPLLGLMLYGLGIRLSTGSVLAALAVEVAAATAAGLVQERGRGPARTAAAPPAWSTSGTALLALAAIVLLPLAVRPHLPAPAAPPFSQLSLTEEAARSARLTRVHGSALAIDATVENHTGQARRYTLLGRVDARAAHPATSFTLADGGVATGRVRLEIPRSPCAHRAQVVLRDDAIRRVVATVGVWTIRQAAVCRVGG